MYGLNSYAIPAVVAVIACETIWYLTRRRVAKTGSLPQCCTSTTTQHSWRLYRAFTLTVGLLNVSELMLFVFANNQLPGSLYAGLLYYSLSVFVLAVLAHFSFALATDLHKLRQRKFYEALLYAPAVLLQIPLWFSNWLVEGYNADVDVMPGIIWSSVRGPGYSMIIGVLMLYLVTSAAVLIMGANSQNKQRKLQCYVVLLSSIPLFAFTCVILLQVMRILPLNPSINSTFSTPFGAILFLVGTGYAIRQNRLIDIELYIPWSSERKKKQAFYERIRNTAERMPQLYSPEEAMQYVSDVLRCPVVVRSHESTIMTPSPVSKEMAEMPIEELSQYDNIITADEICTKNAELGKLMYKHKVFAAVPMPQQAGRGAVAMWVLLGKELADTVYTTNDFAMIGLLFHRMEAVFFNQIGSLRKEMNEMRGKLVKLEATGDVLSEQVSALTGQQQIGLFGAINQNATQLIKSEEAVAANRIQQSAHGLLYIGHDRTMFYTLRKAFPHIKKALRSGTRTYIGDHKPAVIIYDRTRVSEADEVALVNAMEGGSWPVACYVMGRQAELFVNQYEQRLQEIRLLLLPNSTTPETIVEEIYKGYLSTTAPALNGVHLDRLVDEFERKVIEMALHHASWRQATAARILDLSPSTLMKKMSRLGIARGRRRKPDQQLTSMS